MVQLKYLSYVPIQNGGINVRIFKQNNRTKPKPLASYEEIVVDFDSMELGI